MPAWRAYYDDGSEFSSSKARWEDLPAEGIQAVILYGSDSREVVMGLDHFDPLDTGSIKAGRWMDDEGFAAIVDRALASEAP